jgi:hypothetical protein
MQMSTTSRPRIKSQSVVTKCQVEIVDLKGSYLRSAGTKSAAILDGTKLCRVEEFAARHFRRSGFETTFLESAPLHVLFGVYFWSVIQDCCDRRVQTVGILDRQAYDQHRPSEVIWIRLPSDFGTADYARRRAKAITKHLAAIAETSAELLQLFDNWLAPSVGDKLNENQKRWIEDNHRYLHLPFKLVQVHRMEADVSASAVGSRAGPRDRVGGQRC